MRYLPHITILFFLCLVGCESKPSVEQKTVAEKSKKSIQETEKTVAPSQQNELGEHLGSLASEDWPKVNKAKIKIESLGGKHIPSLVKLLRKRDRIPLKNTADLIYPGAKEFFGHGMGVPYELHDIGVRAGWVLEELTFQSFGFQEGTFMSKNQSEKELEERRKRIEGAVTLAENWWKKSKNGWTRYRALQDALKCDDPTRQYSALMWLRMGRSSCEGLNPKVFKSEIVPLVKQLKTSNNKGVSDQATELLEDTEGWWWKIKSADWYDAHPLP